MTSGVYIRTKPGWAKGLTKKTDIRIAKRMLSRNPAEIERFRELGKRPRTQKQRQAARKSGLNNTGDKQVKHHNDLCQGILRPDDIALMTRSEHRSLHAKLRVQNGTHHFLAKNRKKYG